MKTVFFRRELRVGEGIKPFMVCGVIEKPYVGERSHKAYEAATDLMLEEAAEYFSDKSFKEFDSFSVLETDARWQMYVENAPVYAAGGYYVMEKHALLPIYIELESAEAQSVELGVMTDRCIVLHNGNRVYNNTDLYSRPKKRNYVFEHVGVQNNERVRLELSRGKNTVIILSGRIARSTGMSFAVSLNSSEAPLYATVPICYDEELRAEIYISQTRTHMLDDSYVAGEEPELFVGNETGRYTVEVRLDGGEPLPIVDGTVKMPGSHAIGNHRVDVSWKLPDGSLISKNSYSYGIARMLAPLPGFDSFEKRRRIALEDLAKKKNPLALYRLGRADEISAEDIEKMCEKIVRREDCADFHLLPLLWLAWEDRNAHYLSEELCKKIKQAALSFRYWVDEPGVSSMYYCSENHRIGFHVCEYLAGLLYPSDVFENCSERGVFHSLKGRMHLIEWLNQRCRMGFDEPLSDNYLPVTLSAILVLREVLPLEEYPLRNMVNVLLDFMTYIVAVSTFDGVMATPRARSYNRQLRTKNSSPVSAVAWMLFGNSTANAALLLPELAFSYYAPPMALAELADDFTPATFTYKQGLMHFDKHNADFTVYRTPDYMIGGVRDHNVGMCDMHFIPAMIALKDDISIFFSAPQNIAEGAGLRPDYWAGQAHLPRVLNHKRSMAVIYNNVKNPKIWMTHCHFNKRRFDEVATLDGVTFGRKGEGYVAIWSSVPHALSKEGRYAGRELIANGSECVWVAFAGSLIEDGSFAEFIDKILSHKPMLVGSECSFTSPDGETVSFGCDSGFSVDGKEVPVSDYMAYSPYLRSKYGSGKFEYSYKDMNVTFWTYPAAE